MAIRRKAITDAYRFRLARRVGSAYIYDEVANWHSAGLPKPCEQLQAGARSNHAIETASDHRPDPHAISRPGVDGCGSVPRPLQDELPPHLHGAGKIEPAARRGWQRCHSCGKTWIYGHSREPDPDIKALFYTCSDGVKGSSYPMCAEHRPEQIARLTRMGFTDVEARYV